MSVFPFKRLTVTVPYIMVEFCPPWYPFMFKEQLTYIHCTFIEDDDESDADLYTGMKPWRFDTATWLDAHMSGFDEALAREIRYAVEDQMIDRTDDLLLSEGLYEVTICLHTLTVLLRYRYGT